MDHLITIIATALYAGFLPLVPGVWGAALGLVLWVWAKNLALPSYLGIAVVLFLIGLWVTPHAERLFSQSDARPIVIDEVLGLFIALAAAGKLKFGWLVGFVVFLLLDWCKPFPASWFDTEQSGGFGLMMDDVVAGIYTLLLLCLLTLCGPWKKAPLAP